MWFVIFSVVGLVVSAYFYLTWNFEYWKTRGVLSPKPKVLFGNFADSTMRKCHATDDLTRIYNDYKNRASFIGIYQMRSPRVLVLEPELVKEILVKNFRNFSDNEFANTFDEKMDPLFARNPFLSKGEEWKERRNEISPAFSSNRLKALFPLIENVCQRFSKFIDENINEPFEVKELSTKFTTEAVSNCIFGIEANSFAKEESELRTMAQRLFKPSGWTVAKFILATIVPSLKSLLKIQLVPQDVNDYFMSLIDQATNYRIKNQVSRDDYLDYLIKLQKKKGLSSADLAGHSITFFSDGLETSSIAIAHTLYELARNPKVQDKLRKEIQEHNSKSEGLSIETIGEITYLDQVFNESLRLHPPFAALSKVCTEDTEIKHLDGTSVVIEKDLNIYIPLYQIQRDPEYYPMPLEFIPERFDSANGGIKAFKDRGVFLTFGDGPRFCLGMKFATMQSKAAIVEIIKNFIISVNDKTEKDLVIDPNEFMNIKRGGLWLDFKPVKVFKL